jgi:glucose-1-phosphate adenylyltransferase
VACEFHPEHVLILAADHVYKMNYARMLADHVERRADATVACIEVPAENASGLGVMGVGGDGRVTAFVEKPDAPDALPR